MRSDSPTHPPAESSNKSSDLDASFLSNIAWSAAAKWSAQGAAWLSTIIVARLLTPEDFGLMGMAALFIGVVTMLTEMGVGLSVLVLRELTEEQLAQLNSVALLMGVVGFAASMVAAQPIASFFNAPKVSGIVRVLAATFVLGGLRSIPLALLQRTLRFKRVAAIETIASLASAVTVASLAIAGFGYWALVLGQLAQVAASAILVVASKPTSFRRPRWEALRRALGFSKTIVVGNSAWYVYSNADFLVAGRLLGTTALGIYSFGWNIITVALDKVSTLVNAVTPAYFSALQTDRKGLRRMLLGITEVLALLIFPATAGIALVASDLVPLVFGAKWAGAVPVIQLLAVFNAMRMLRPVVNNVLINIGEERFTMWVGVCSAVIFPVGFLLASRFGPVGIAAAWLALYPTTSAAIYWRLFRSGVASGSDYWGAISPAASATAIMILAVGFARLALSHSPPVWRLAAAVALGVTVYACTLWFGYRSRVERFVRIFAQVRRGARVAEKA